MSSIHTYLALGDSMSIDDYTGVSGGGAVSQFHRMLGVGWQLDDRTCDGCTIPLVPHRGRGDVITLTVGGNDLLRSRDDYLRDGLNAFAHDHLGLLRAIRLHNPEAIFIVGDVYQPALALSVVETATLAAANEIIRDNISAVGSYWAPIHDAFLGHEADYLCFAIEPTLAGATTIARLFKDAYLRAGLTARITDGRGTR